MALAPQGRGTCWNLPSAPGGLTGLFPQGTFRELEKMDYPSASPRQACDPIFRVTRGLLGKEWEGGSLTVWLLLPGLTWSLMTTSLVRGVSLCRQRKEVAQCALLSHNT